MSELSIQPKYRQVKDWIIEKIKSGVIADGAFLPSEADLCNILHVGRVTVRSAIKELEKEKVITKQRGCRGIVNSTQVLQVKTEDMRMRLAWLCNTGFSEIEEIHFQIYNYMLRQAEEHNTDILFFSLQERSNMEWLAEHIGNFDGIVMTAGVKSRTISPELEAKIRGIEKLIVIDHAKNNLAKYFVSTDNYLGGRMAAEHLIKHGTKEPTLIIRNYNEAFNPISERAKGFQDCLYENNLPLRLLKLYDSPETFALASETLKNYLDKNPDTDAFFCVTDTIAIHLLFLLKSQGIRIPQDIAVMGYDGIPRSMETYPTLTTIQQPTKEIARHVFDLILKLQQGVISDSNIIKIAPTIQEGESV